MNKIFLHIILLLSCTALMAEPVKFTTTDAVINYLHASLGDKVTRSMPGAITAEMCHQQFEAVTGNDRAIRRLMVAHLEVAESYIAQGGSIAQTGLEITSAAMMAATMRLKDFQLAASIAVSFILPNSQLANQDEVNGNCGVEMLKTSAGTLYVISDKDYLVKVYEAMIKLSKRNCTRDAARIKIAESYASQGRYLDAVDTLDEMTDPSLVKGMAAYREILVKKVTGAK